MSALTKKHHTDKIANVSWHGGHYAVPINIIEQYKVKLDHNDYMSIEDVFGDLLQEKSEPGVLLKGLRYREGLSQIEFSKRVNISQTNLSAMENSRRNIGKELAKRIADIFELDYRIFL